MSFRYAVLGAGMQGTAATYDLSTHGDAEAVWLYDQDLDRAQRAARRVNDLIQRELVRPDALDAADLQGVTAALRGKHACLSAAPYRYNALLAQAAVGAGVHFNDLGGNTAVVRAELTLDAAARQAGVSIIPDCGVAPGMANSLAVYGLNLIAQPQSARIWCGGLPQNRDLPLGYKTLFALEGLTNEYFGHALVLRNGQCVEIPTFEELEGVDFAEPLGRLEAFTTSGGASTCPETFEGQLQTYEYKTLRYPGHYAVLKQFHALGFLDLEPVDVQGCAVVPRDLFHAVMARIWNRPAERDLLALRIDVTGLDAAQTQQRRRIELIDAYDERTGFSAMERTTAFAAAIVTIMQAHGETPIGAHTVERGVPAARFVAELKRRQFPLTIQHF